MDNCAAPEGETHAGRDNRRRTRPQTAKRHPRPRKRRTRGSEIRGPEEFEPEARASGMEAGDCSPETREMSRGAGSRKGTMRREERGQERRRTPEGRDVEEVFRRKASAADLRIRRFRQRRHVSALHAHAKIRIRCPRRRAPSARLCNVPRKHAFTRIFPFRERHTPSRSSPSAHNVPRRRSPRAAQMSFERPLHRPG